MAYGRLRHPAGKFPVSIRDAHGETQLERIGKLYPVVHDTAVYDICRRREIVEPLRHKSRDSSIKFREHCPVDIHLTVIRDIDFPVLAYLRIRDRPVGVSYAMHGGHLYDIADSPYDRVVRYLMQQPVVRIDGRDNP